MEKIAIIGTAGTPSRYGGFETLVQNLILNWKDKFSVYVYCSTKFYKKSERPSTWEGAKLYYLPLNANGAQSILYDIISMVHAIFYADTLLILGTSGCIILPLIRLFTNKKIIVNIDGQEWKRQKWNPYIRKFLKLSEYFAVKFSHADIADNASIKKYTSINYKTLSYQIEYGADHTSRVLLNEEDIVKYPILREKYFFKVCRIEPENNVHLILQAFSKMPEKKLVIVGNWNHSAYGIQLKEIFSSFNNIHILDPIYHQRTLDVLRSNCEVYIHGHSAGGTNPSLVEAMYLELPIIAFNVSYNVSTTKNKALYFKSEVDLKTTIESTEPERLKELAKDMKRIADEFYLWRIIANKYAHLIYTFSNNYSKKQVHPLLSKFNPKLLQRVGAMHLKYVRAYFE